MAPKAKSCAPLQSDSVAEFVSSLEATNFIGGVKCCGCETNFKSPKGLRDHLKKHGVEGAAVQKLVQFRTQLEKDQRALPDVSPALTDLEKSKIEPIPGGDHKAVRCLGCGRYPDGFPAAANIRQLFTEQLREWLRDPDDVLKLVHAICGYRIRYTTDANATPQRQSWDCLTVDGIAAPAPPPKRSAPSPQRGWSGAFGDTPQLKRRKGWNSLDDETSKRSEQFSQIELDDEEEDESSTTENVLTVWDQGSVQSVSAFTQNALNTVGQKAGVAPKIQDYAQAFDAIPDVVLEHFGLLEAIKKLHKYKQVPRNIQPILNRVKVMCDAGLQLYEEQSAHGKGSAPSSGALLPPPTDEQPKGWDTIDIPQSQHSQT